MKAPAAQVPAAVREAEAALRAFALAYPQAREDFPWGERVLKVKDKIFVFLGAFGPELSVTVKLPHSASMALALPNVTPTGYGLGKSGWVSARFAARARPPLPLLKQWIDESYRAVAPKRLVAALDAAASAAPAPAAPRARSSRPRAQGPASRARAAPRPSSRRR